MITWILVNVIITVIIIVWYVKWDTSITFYVVCQVLFLSTNPYRIYQVLFSIKSSIYFLTKYRYILCLINISICTKRGSNVYLSMQMYDCVMY